MQRIEGRQRAQPVGPFDKADRGLEGRLQPQFGNFVGMGQPVKIAELAEKLIHLSGLSVRSEKCPHGDIAIEYTGLRPGEKLYEELLIGDNVSATEHPMIMRANEEHLDWDVLKDRLAKLLKAVESDDYPQVRQLLREVVSGYVPEGEIVDWIYQQRRVEPE